MKTQTHRTWTTKEITYLIQANKNGVRQKDIAQALGRPVNSIRAKRSELGLKSPHYGCWNHKKLKKVNQLHEKGHTYKEIAAKLGVSENGLYMARKRSSE